MCGIAGWLSDDPARPADAAAVQRMCDALAHRGPDDAGLWCEGPAALGHRRLSVIDTSAAGHQPMASACGRYVAAYNGELYNFRALRAELDRLGQRFRTQCDTEVLIAAWRAWGEAALDRFNGMFAFAVYDRHERRLALARDRMGEKPLFYAHHGGAFVFASELRALRASGLVPSELRPASLDAYFAYLYVPAPETIYAHAHKLPPAARMTVHAGRAETARWWSIDWRPRPRMALDTAAEEYRALLDDSVRLRMTADVPVGAFLSGGLDSSSVAAAMARHSAQPIATFSIGFDDAHYDELRYARIAAQHLGADHHEELLRPDWAAMLPQLMRHFGEPFADSSALPMWLVSRMARRKVTVALSGDGGDELFAGYDWTRMTLRALQFARVPAPLRRAAAAALRRLPAGPRRARLLHFHEDAMRPPAEAFRRRLTCLDPALRAALLRPECGGGPDRFLDHWNAAPADGATRMLAADTAMYLPDDILTKVDRMSMAHGLEARVPLLDHRIAEWAAGLPFDLKLRGRTAKRVAKAAMCGLLPPALLAPRKQGFAIPVHAWFRGPLAAPFEETVLAPDARCAEWLRPDTARAVFEAHRARRADRGHALWAMLAFELWLRET